MTAEPPRTDHARPAAGGAPVRVLDVSWRGRSWQLHDVGRSTWLVYPWGSTVRLWGRFHAIEWAARESRWEAINRTGDVRRCGSFADAAIFACVGHDRSLLAAGPDAATRAVVRLDRPGAGRVAAWDGPGR